MTSLHAVFLTKTIDRAIYNTNITAIRTLISSVENAKIKLSVTLVESNQNINTNEYTYPEAVDVIIPKESFNFNRFLNLGASGHIADYYAFCNNDIEFHDDWFEYIINVATRHPEITSYSPRCSLSQRQQDLASTDREFILGYRPTFELSGWCIVVKKELWLGHRIFDEAFSFYFADDDYSMTLRQKNVKHCLVLNSIVDHIESKKVSHKELESANKPSGRLSKLRRFSWILENPPMLRGYKIFSNKWGVNMYGYALIRILHDFFFLKLGWYWPTKLIIRRKDKK